MFGLFKSLSDMEDLDYEKVKKYPDYKDVVVIGLNTSELGELEMVFETSHTFTQLMRNGKIVIVQFYRFKVISNLSFYQE